MKISSPPGFGPIPSEFLLLLLLFLLFLFFFFKFDYFFFALLLFCLEIGFTEVHFEFFYVFFIFK